MQGVNPHLPSDNLKQIPSNNPIFQFLQEMPEGAAAAGASGEGSDGERDVVTPSTSWPGVASRDICFDLAESSELKVRRGRERGIPSGGLTREVDTALPSNSPHDHMILREDLEAHTGGGNGLAFKKPT